MSVFAQETFNEVVFVLLEGHCLLLHHESTFVCYSRNFTSNHNSRRQYLRCSLCLLHLERSFGQAEVQNKTTLVLSFLTSYTYMGLLGFCFWFQQFVAGKHLLGAQKEHIQPNTALKISLKRLLGHDSNSRSDETKSLITSFLQLPIGRQIRFPDQGMEIYISPGMFHLPSLCPHKSLEVVCGCTILAGYATQCISDMKFITEVLAEHPLLKPQVLRTWNAYLAVVSYAIVSFY